MPVLLMRLEGPLQSWGDHSYWDERDSSATPTKSGIVGLIGNCMGLGRDDSEIERLYESIRIAVRVDDPGQYMSDFQTIANTRTASGKRNPNMVISPRQYLANASFLVAVDVLDEVYAKDLKDALTHPKRPPYLGRKCCIPTVPIYSGLFDDGEMEDILISDTLPIHHNGTPPKFLQLEMEGEPKGDEPLFRRRDVLGTLRTYRYRGVYQKIIPTDQMTFHPIDNLADKEESYVSGTN
jgi:CRISPR system Cascade subunit CasD